MSILRTTTTPLWVTSREARKLLGISATSLYRMRKGDLIRCKPMFPNAKSPTWLYLYEDLERK